MNMLGIDVGTKRIGLARVQTGLDVVLPFGVVAAADAFEKISALVGDEHIETIVVGFPVGLDGKASDMSDRVQTFVATLKQQVSVPVVCIDERFTTAQAQRMGGDASSDEKAAMLILQMYLEKTEK